MILPRVPDFALDSTLRVARNPHGRARTFRFIGRLAGRPRIPGRHGGADVIFGDAGNDRLDEGEEIVGRVKPAGRSMGREAPKIYDPRTALRLSRLRWLGFHFVSTQPTALSPLLLSCYHPLGLPLQRYVPWFQHLYHNVYRCSARSFFILFVLLSI
jgi:hypothetical protein